MKFMVLLLAVLVATPGVRCEQTCQQSWNALCDFFYKGCSKFPFLLFKCLADQTTCKLKSTKFCSCVGKCQQDCMKPQGACNSTSPAAGNSLCKTQQELCKQVSCDFKCFSNLLPAFPKLGIELPNLGSALPKLGTELPNLGSALPKFGTGLPLPGLGLPLPASGLPPPPGLPPLPIPESPFSAPGLPFSAAGLPAPAPVLSKPALGLPLPAPPPGVLTPQLLNTKPADDAAKSAKEPSATGPVSLNPAGKPKSPATKPLAEDYDEERQAPIPTPKHVTKPGNRSPNSANSKSYNPGPSYPSQSGKTAGSKYSFLAGRK